MASSIELPWKVITTGALVTVSGAMSTRNTDRQPGYVRAAAKSIGWYFESPLTAAASAPRQADAR